MIGRTMTVIVPSLFGVRRPSGRSDAFSLGAQSHAGDLDDQCHISHLRCGPHEGTDVWVAATCEKETAMDGMQRRFPWRGGRLAVDLERASK
jgi:hypothetical protein